jgi:hypothetical protein
MTTSKHGYEQDWYDRLKVIADRIDKDARALQLIGSEPTILEETAAEDEPQLATRR